MVLVRLQYRNRPNWLWAFSFVVLLLPFMLGQSSAGGCGATVTVPSPDPDSGPNGTLDETIIVDSDADGFSDDQEINSTPGTDPFDPTDNPTNVHDSDGDGCSDFDEIYFENFCDNDPDTPLGCDTTLYNAYYGYGFDLPSNADELDALLWAFTFAGVRMSVSTRVEVSPPVSLEDYVIGLSQYFNEVAGWETLSTNSVQLSDGTSAYFVIMTTPSLWDYTLYAIAGPYLYRLSASGEIEDLNNVVSDEASRILESLCIE